MRTKLSFLLPLPLLILASVAQGQEKPRPQPRLRVLEFHGSFTALLAQYAHDYETTIGFETDPQNSHPEITLHLKDFDFYGFLDGIVKAQPEFRWQQVDDAIEIFPANRGPSLLDAQIDDFEVKDVNSYLAVNHLLEVPAVHTKMISMNLKPLLYPAPDWAKKQRLSFKFSGVTLRQAMNRIATDSGAKFWVFRKHPDGTFELTFSWR